MEILMIIFVCILAAAVISGIAMMIVRKGLKSVRQERTACNYVRGGSFRVTDQKDVFLTRHLSRVKRAQQTGGSGGGSRSTAGRTSGGFNRGGGSSRGGGAGRR